MKRFSKVGLLLGAAALVSVAGAASADQGVSSDEIVLGSHQPLSGPVAVWGVPVTNGMRMRVDEVNAEGGVHGRKINLVVEDNQYSPAKAAQAGNKLLKRDQVFALVGALGTPPNMAVMPSAFQRDVFNVFPFSGGRQMYEPFHRLKFSFAAPYYDQMRAATKYFIEERGKKNVCTMYQDTDFGREIHEGVVDQLDAMNMELTASSTHKPSTKDFSAPLTNLKNAGCDVIMLGTIVGDTIIPAGTAKKMGWNVDFVASTAGFTSAVTAVGKGAVEGVYATGQFMMPYPEDASAAVKDWMQRYEEKFGKAPVNEAAFGYSAMDMFVYALDKAGRDLTVDSMVEALESIDGWTDRFGGPPQSFGPEKRLGTNKSALYQVKNGRWEKQTGFLTY
jgi:branched-chain amino acid transport system substrate-binding protein